MERYVSSVSHIPLCAVPEGISVDVVGSMIRYGPQGTWEVVLQIPVSDYDPINTEILLIPLNLHAASQQLLWTYPRIVQDVHTGKHCTNTNVKYQ